MSGPPFSLYWTLFAAYLGKKYWSRK